MKDLLVGLGILIGIGSIALGIYGYINQEQYGLYNETPEEEVSNNNERRLLTCSKTEYSEEHEASLSINVNIEFDMFDNLTTIETRLTYHFTNEVAYNNWKGIFSLENIEFDDENMIIIQRVEENNEVPRSFNAAKTHFENNGYNCLVR